MKINFMIRALDSEMIIIRNFFSCRAVSYKFKQNIRHHHEWLQQDSHKSKTQQKLD